LRIEEFLPERLKLDLTSEQAQLASGEALSLNVQGDYLYGAPAAGNRFTARLSLTADVHPIEQHKDFYFGDPTIDLPKEAKDVIDSKLDETGKLSESLTLLDDKKAAPVAAIISGSVYETGGRTVTRTLKRTIWPAAELVGVRPLFDVDEGSDANGRAGFELIRSNAAGELAAGSLKVTLVRERRNYHWTFDNDSGWHFDYTRNFEDVETKDIQLAAGEVAKFD